MCEGHEHLNFRIRWWQKVIGALRLTTLRSIFWILKLQSWIGATPGPASPGVDTMSTILTGVRNPPTDSGAYAAT